MKKKSEEIVGTEKEFLDIFRTLCRTRSAWQVWADVISAMACSLSNAVDRTPGRYEKREKEYEQCIKRIGSVETVAKLFAVVTMAFEKNSDQDFLGKMYMDLELSSRWKGQFFTPYCICKAMTEIVVGKADEQIEKNGYISVCDPACGAGATLIATVNKMKLSKYNFQNHVLFVGQDVDRVTGLMCYIQLSLLGCAGYICIGDTLTNPLTGHILFPNEREGQELWIMPMFRVGAWTWRRMFCLIGSMSPEKNREQSKEKFYMFFDFEKENAGGKQCETLCAGAK